jgi:radical SAM superfamily enzyme YgiQ (UPF0313 family)
MLAMNTLLVQPPLTMSPEVHPPLGLCVLASHLRGSGHTVSILDLDLEEKSASYNPDHYIETFTSALREKRPGVVGFTSMFNNSLHAERLIRATKDVDAGIVTVAGGSHFGALPQQSLDRIPELDFVVRGEGEVAFSQLLSALNQGTSARDTPGLCYRAPSGFVENPAGPMLDLKNVNPVWTRLEGVLDLRRYTATAPADSPRKAVYVEAGRGCPFDCSFCATAPFWHRRYRVKAIDCIIAEMRHLYEQYQYDTFMLVHDLLTADRHFVSDFCDALFSARLPVEWTANHRADIELGALAPKMRSAGCLSVFMGIESASERIQKEVSKGLTRGQVMSTVNSLRDVGISSTCSFIIGFPSETAADLSATLELAGRLKMIGAEPVQVHRLRRWPPAPLAALDLPASFDLEALRLEFPSDTIPDADIQTIQSDPAFFMGYFTPETVAGSAFQLAQLELLFANMLGTLSITSATLGVIYRDRLVPAYYKALARLGPISRADLASAVSVRDALVPYLQSWVAHDDELSQWQRDLLNGILLYEEVRIGFMAGAEDAYTNAVASGASWAVFTTAIDVVELLRRLAAGLELTPDLCSNGHVAMSRRGDGAVRGFALGERSIERLRQGDSELLSILEGDGHSDNVLVA